MSENRETNPMMPSGTEEKEVKLTIEESITSLTMKFENAEGDLNSLEEVKKRMQEEMERIEALIEEKKQDKEQTGQLLKEELRKKRYIKLSSEGSKASGEKRHLESEFKKTCKLA